MTNFKIGDIVQIAPNNRSLDCCQGKRGRIAHRPAGCVGGDSWLLNTDHFCPVIRQEGELTLVPALALAIEYFDDEGWEVYMRLVKAYQGDKTIFKHLAGSISHHANVLVEAGFDLEQHLAVA